MSENRGNEATEKDGALDEVAEVLLRHGELPEVWQQGRPNGTRHCPMLEKLGGSRNPRSSKRMCITVLMSALTRATSDTRRIQSDQRREGGYSCEGSPSSTRKSACSKQRTSCCSEASLGNGWPVIVSRSGELDRGARASGSARDPLPGDSRRWTSVPATAPGPC